MFNFKSFLTEDASDPGTKLGHITHAHRSMFVFAKPRKNKTTGEILPPTDEEKSTGGDAGIAMTDKMLRYAHNHLRGAAVPNNVTVTEKMEGSPSFLIRKHRGVTSVGYKGAVGKDGKISEDKMASTHEDIDRLFGHAPGLADKMHRLLDHGGKILPDSPKIFSGDYMGDPSELHSDAHQHSILPNAIAYHFGKDTPEGIKAKNAKIIMALHSQYIPKSGAEPIDKKTRDSFVDHPDVHNMDPTVNVNPQNYTPEEQTEYALHMKNAAKTYSKIKEDSKDSPGNGFNDVMRRHGENIESYMSHTIRNDLTPSVQGYIDHLNSKSAARLAKPLSDKVKNNESRKHADNVADVIANQHHIKNSFDLMNHFKNAQEVLRKVAAKNSPFSTSINGEASEGEGLVVTHHHPDGTTSYNKAANPWFTKYNLTGGGAVAQRQASAKLTAPASEAPSPTPALAAPIKEDVEKPNSHGVIIGGFSPYTIAHHSVVNTMQNAGHDSNNVFVTKSTGRPIPIENKIDDIKNATGPNVNVSPTVTPFHALRDMWNSGKRGSVTIYGGSDRKPMADRLRDYKDVEGEHGFDVHFHQVGGERKSGAQGMDGVSGTAARAAKSPEELKKVLPPANYDRAERIFNDINTPQEIKPKKARAIKEAWTSFRSFR
jgi:hypothetical protein